MSKKQRAESRELRAEGLQAKLNELTEALMRERADSENIRRRHEEQIMGLKTVVKANIVRELLPVIDNIERALSHQPKGSGLKTWEDWAKGVMGVKAQFDKVLSDIGVERIKTVGQVFDPRLHEAVAVEEGAGAIEVVCEELQSGYKLSDEIIRHAMVKVKMQSAPKPSDEGGENK